MQAVKKHFRNLVPAPMHIVTVLLTTLLC